MKTSPKLVFVILLSLISANTYLYSAGTTSANFLKISPNARASGFGEAFTSISNDVSAIYWNPAGLSGLGSKELVLSHNIWFQDIQHSFAAFAIPIDSSTGKTIAVSVTYLGITGLERRTSNTAASEGSFGANDLAIAVAYAGKSCERSPLSYSYGIALKYIKQTIDSYNASAFAADLGLITPIKLSEIPVSLGLGIQNIGTSLKFVNEEYQLPLVYKIGLSASPFCGGKLPLLVAVDADFPNDSDATLKLGAEYMASPLLCVRAGYTFMNSGTKDAISGGALGSFSNSSLTGLSGFSAGFGVNLPMKNLANFSEGIRLDYAFVPYGELGNTHKISLGMKW